VHTSHTVLINSTVRWVYSCSATAWYAVAASHAANNGSGLRRANRRTGMCYYSVTWACRVAEK